MNPYREQSIPVERYPKKKRKIHAYISAHDAQILEQIYCEWTPSKGYDILADLLSCLEGDFAKRIIWAEMHYHCEQMAAWLMRREES